jgi:hypothetical protein
MKEKLTQLYNTLCLVETKGNSTLIMADCIKFVEHCINECEEPETATE